MITLVEFADLVNEELSVIYHPNQNNRFSCCFAHGEIKMKLCLISEFGNGHTPEEAMNKYAKAISGKTIIFHAMSDYLRKEYHVPMFKDCV